MSQTIAPPTPMDPVAGLNDFPDRFSPIIVKELRQGLRQASFVILFLFLQTVLALAVISSLIAISPTSLSSRLEVGNTISGFFFGLFGLAVLVLQPLRGLSSISSEIKENTIDLLLLTRLDSWRIAFGKWLSLVTQSALLLIAILPYLMMRYFLGGMNLLAELGWLAFLFLVGAMFCAMGVGMSAVKSGIIRSVFVVIGVILLIMMTQGMGMMFLFRGSVAPGFSGVMATHEWVLLWVGIILLVSYLTFAFLEFAATRIAPPAENRATRKRLISVAALIVIPAFFTLSHEEFHTMAFISIYLIAAFTLLDSLSENPMYAHIQHRKSLPMLRPGWPSGAIFGLCIVAICIFWCLVLAIATEANKYGYDTDGFKHLSFLLGAILLAFSQPVLLLALFRNRVTDPPSGYLTALMASTALGLVIMLVAAVADAHEEIGFLLFPFFPVLTLPQIEDPSPAMTVLFFMVSTLYLVLAAVIGRNAYPARKPTST